MLTILLPVPHRALSPNAKRVHWAAKRRYVRAHRLRALEELEKQVGSVGVIENPGMLIVLVKTKSKDNYKSGVWNVQDRDNLHGACKAYIDGLADSGLFGGGDSKLRSYPEFDLSDSTTQLSHLRVYIGELSEIMEVLKCYQQKG